MKTLDDIGENLKRVADIWSEELSEMASTPPFNKEGQAALFPHWEKVSTSLTPLPNTFTNNNHSSLEALTPPSLKSKR